MSDDNAAVADAYHHGDLPNALKQAAVDLIAERGLAGFSLREVARRAGVSHAAPAHHFGDVAGLLTAIAIDAFDHLAITCAEVARAHDDPVDRLAAIGRAYVEAGRTHPGHCAVMFRVDLLDADDPRYVEAGMRSFAILEAAVADVCEDPGDVAEGALLAWCSMQGLLELAPKIAQLAVLRGDVDRELVDHAERFARLTVRGLRGDS